MLRLILYILAGMISALLGWNLSQITLFLLGVIENIPIVHVISLIGQWEEVIVFPLVTVCLTAGMVLNELFITNPTRLSLSLKRAVKPLLFRAIPIGFCLGLLVGGLLQIFYQFNWDEKTIRVLGWWFIGTIIGLSEGLSWEFFSYESGDKQRYHKRLFTSLFGSIIASFIAARIFEWIRTSVNNPSESFQEIEDPLGFCILGTLLGIVLTFTTAPSYQIALRAGTGFEHREYLTNEGMPNNTNNPPPIDPDYTSSNSPPQSPIISKLSVSTLEFVVNPDNNNQIQEGLSIRLPEQGKIIIGGTEKKTLPNNQTIGSDIYLPYTSPHLADLIVSSRETRLRPNPRSYHKIKINGIVLDNAQEIVLKHNTLITFLTNRDENNSPALNDPGMYRFMYYNRFLDPED